MGISRIEGRLRTHSRTFKLEELTSWTLKNLGRLTTHSRALVLEELAKGNPKN
jgi:hypothetical protein